MSSGIGDDRSGAMVTPEGVSWPPGCSSVDPAIACNARREAEREGRMVRDREPESWGPQTDVPRLWLFPVDELYAFTRRLPSHGWAFCPFCGNDLPLAAPPPKFFDGEDGG